MRTLILILSLFTMLSATAQDTIVYKNATKLAVILKEISPTEIRYKRAEMPDGPDYVVNKSEVDRVIFRNGIAETMQSPVVTQPVQAATSETGFSINPAGGKISYRDAKQKYRFLNEIALSHPDTRRRPPLTELVSDIRHHKNVQDGTRTGAIVCGGLAIGGLALYSLSYAISNGSSEPIFYVPPAVLGGLALGLGSVSIVYNIRLKEKRKEFVDLYNE